MFLSEADGMDGNALAADFGNRFEIDAAGIIGAVAQQDHGADGQAGGVGNHLLQTFANVRRGESARSTDPAYRSGPGDRPYGTAVPEIYPVRHSAGRS